MKTTLKLSLLALVALLIAVYHARLIRACSPQAFMPEPIFINTLHPDPQVALLGNAGSPQPTLSYAMGDLGVIFPTYAPIYLYVAYRNLTSGFPSTPEQTALWDTGMKLVANHGMLPAAEPATGQAGESTANNDWEQQWESAIGGVPERVPTRVQFAFGYVPGAGIYKQAAVHESWGVEYTQFLNCPQDGFHFALTTLQQLRGQFGGSSPIVQNWVQAQQAVFDDCSGGNQVPEALPSGAPALAREARAYQIAAAHFYSGNYEHAAADFQAIAKNSASPWSTVAPYLGARSLVREATMGNTPGPDLNVLARAEAQIDSLLANPGYAKYHFAAEQLRGFIEFRLHPHQRLVELADNLTKFGGDPNFRQDVIDFKLLFPSVAGSVEYEGSSAASNDDAHLKLADMRAKSDLLDWMFTMQMAGPEAYGHAFEKWQHAYTAHQASEVWLIAALTKASADSPHLPELLAAVGKVLPASLAYDSVTFQSLRLLLLSGDEKEARSRLAQLDIHHLDRQADLPTLPSTLNLFLAVRFELAQNLNELFEEAPRVPATITDADSSLELPQPIWEPSGENRLDPSAAMLDDDAVMVFNRFLPVALLAKAALSPELPENLRREIALAAWMRAALLGDAAVARSLGPAVDTFEPALSSSVQAYDAATDPGARGFAAAVAALRFPGMSPFITSFERTTSLDQIDDYRNNWWGTEGMLCAPPNPGNGRPGYPPIPQWPTVAPVLQAIYPGGEIRPPAFLTAREDAEAAREWQRLMAMSPAPDYLSAQVLAWAKSHPSDAGLPEALALAVRSTRSGCADPQTGQLSKAAFDLLHGRYPNSSWAQKTKYWFTM